MQRRHFIASLGLGALAGCGTSLPLPDWFGREERIDTVEPVEVAPDPRPLVAQVTRLEVERHPSGAIVRATGLPQRQGWYDGRLIRVPSGDPGVLAYQLRAWPPPFRTLVATPRSREITVATFLSDDLLAGIREIRVSGEFNALAARR